MQALHCVGRYDLVMGNAIYLVDPDTRVPVRVEQVGLSDIGIKERTDLEAWVIANPKLLGERLLVISVEFYRFDRAPERLDILAIDERGVLVIVELKLDLEGSHADLQAIRYAAFCSTMTMQDVVEELAATKSKSEEEAENVLSHSLKWMSCLNWATSPGSYLRLDHLRTRRLRLAFFGCENSASTSRASSSPHTEYRADRS